jgi:AraC-like DNA-binding protein
LSQSSKTALDPLSDVLKVLGARVSRRTRLEAAGQWALAFPAIDRLKFVALLRGDQWVLLPGRPPQRMTEGEVCLIGRVPYVVASDPEVMPTNGEAYFDASRRDVARLGGDDVVGIGGTVIFSANADFLLDMLPQFMIVPRSSRSSGSIATVLSLMSSELQQDVMGSEIVSARLADILLVEAIRAFAYCAEPEEFGWLNALADDRIGRAICAIHEHVALPWTVARLAAVAGMSRASFSSEFARRIGKPPLTYLRAWRLTLARASLMRSDMTVARVAQEVGYTSQSAFAYAFRHAFGYSPKSAGRQMNVKSTCF